MKNGVKYTQAAGYSGACTVIRWIYPKLFTWIVAWIYLTNFSSWVSIFAACNAAWHQSIKLSKYSDSLAAKAIFIISLRPDHVISTGCQLTNLVSNFNHLLLLCFLTNAKICNLGHSTQGLFGTLRSTLKTDLRQGPEIGLHQLYPNDLQWPIWYRIWGLYLLGRYLVFPWTTWHHCTVGKMAPNRP